MHKTLLYALLTIICFVANGNTRDAPQKKNCSICKGRETVKRFVPCDNCNGSGVVQAIGSAGIISRHTTHLTYIGSSITRTSRSGKRSVINNRCPKCKNSIKRGYVRKDVPCKCTTDAQVTSQGK